jgi:hypothetical protein
VGNLDEKKIRVQSPAAVAFLCGGPCSSLGAPVPLSLRDAFLKIADNPSLRGKTLIQAEDVTSLSFFKDCYDDLLKFETDLAQITDLVILFCESEGSFAELGAFSMVPEISERLFVVVRGRYWENDSFIKLGPIRALINLYGKESVYVLDDKYVGIYGAGSSGVNISTLKDILQEPLRLRLEKARAPTTFDPQRPGHIIKLIVGVVQEYGALMIDEIENVLKYFSVNVHSDQIAAYLLCARAVNWVVEKTKGYNTYYIAHPIFDAATFFSKETAEIKEKTRRRSAIREHWKTHDPLRYHGIIEICGRGVA